jgi:hypothetical protein
MIKMDKDINFSLLSTVQPGIYTIPIKKKKYEFRVDELGIVGTSGPRDIMNKIELFKFLSVVINLIKMTNTDTVLLLRDSTFQSRELMKTFSSLIAITGVADQIVKVKAPTTTTEAVNCVATYTKEHDIDAIAIILTASHSDPDKFIGFKMVVSLNSLRLLFEPLIGQLELPMVKMYGFLTRSAATNLEKNTIFNMSSPLELKSFKKILLPEEYAQKAMIKTIKGDMEYLGISEDLLQASIKSIPLVIYVNPSVARMYEPFGFKIETEDRPWSLTKTKKDGDYIERKTDTDGDRYGAIEENPEKLFAQILYAAIIVSQKDLPILISQERYTLYIIRAVEQARKKTGLKLPIVVTSQGEASNLVGFYEIALYGYTEAYAMDWAFGLATQKNRILMKRPVLSAILDIIFQYKKLEINFGNIFREEHIIEVGDLNLTERNNLITNSSDLIEEEITSLGNFEFIKMDGLLINGTIEDEEIIVSYRTSGTERIIKIIGFGSDENSIKKVIKIIDDKIRLAGK